MDAIKDAFGLAGAAVEAIGVLVILAGFAAAPLRALPRAWAEGLMAAYKELRIGLGRSLILGLEFLIAGDIIRTVTVTQTLESAVQLAVIVVIRVLLALTLEMEIGERPLRRSVPPDACRR